MDLRLPQHSQFPLFHGPLNMALEGHFPDHQLRQLGNDHDRNPREDGSSTTAAHPPAADSGRAVWLFLFGSFTIEMLVWGFPFSFGVLQDYYTNHRPISLHPAGVSAVGTTCSVRLSFSSHVCQADGLGHHVPRRTPVVCCVSALATHLP
jgi:hypothetical protein